MVCIVGGVCESVSSEGRESLFMTSLVSGKWGHSTTNVIPIVTIIRVIIQSAVIRLLVRWTVLFCSSITCYN
jgi:hypothetical protein